MVLRSLVLAVCVVVAGCGGDGSVSAQSSPSSPPPGNQPANSVRPGDRLGWVQEASSTATLDTFQYALYVDGNRSVLPTASCSPGTTATQFNCSAILPPMNAGTHTIELATFVMSGGNAMESSKSAPLSVTASGLSSATPALPVPVITDEQVQLKLTPVADGLNLPTDLAVAPDGSLFVAERGGTVRLIRDGVVADTPALDISNQLRLPEGGLLSIALDPKFEETGLMFALYAAEAPRDGLEFVLARFRSVNGVFADRAVLLDRIPASTSGASGAVRVGPDGKTYVAMDSSADQRVAGSFATYNGKVLRLNADATTPADQSGSTPIFSLDHPQPNAMDWQPSTGTLWVVDRLGTDAGRLSAVTSGDPNQKRAASRTSYALPQGTGATSASFYGGDLMPIFKGNLFVAAASARELIRLRFDQQNGSKIVSVERMLRGQPGGVRVVAEAPDGSIYLAGESGVYRLAP